MPETITRHRNWAPWIALLLALAALLSNAGYFLGLPGQRALPWLSVALAIAALICAAVGIMRAFRQSQLYRGKVSSRFSACSRCLSAAWLQLRRLARALCLHQQQRRK
ncbi:MAG TPA: hypothetical protein VE054_13855 [Blattabacteriaceae bacterium]|nr:hypothetical protein [Blattabacteriaceae bacterium]